MEKSQQTPKKPTGWDYAIILIIFAITGSTAAYVSKLLMPWFGIESTFWYVVVYIVVITPIYQVLLLSYAFVFGKFHYFLEKQKKIGRWLSRPFRKKKNPHEGNHLHS